MKQRPGGFFNKGTFELRSWRRPWLLQLLPNFEMKSQPFEGSSKLPLTVVGPEFHPQFKKLFSRMPQVPCKCQSWNNNIWKTDCLSEVLYIKSASSTPHRHIYKSRYPDLHLIWTINLHVGRWIYITINEDIWCLYTRLTESIKKTISSSFLKQGGFCSCDCLCTAVSFIVPCQWMHSLQLLFYSEKVNWEH